MDLTELVEQDYKLIKKKKMNILKSVYTWVVYSSANPEKFSLSLKSFVPFVVLLGADANLVDETSNVIVNILVQGGVLVSGLATLFGLARKLAILLKTIITSITG